MHAFTWILHESEAFICKALKGEAIVHYAEPLITQQMKASGSLSLGLAAEGLKEGGNTAFAF